ncbi:MAG: hypothetical protein LUH23_09150 [Oscillospiraceae bacterium]|nr:hypothetical protein [Oscillospiraceae bacterium]
MISPEEALANAIILQGVKDYRMALKALKLNPNNGTAKDTKAEVERFFRSQWFSALSDVSPEFLIERLNEEVFGNDS